MPDRDCWKSVFNQLRFVGIKDDVNKTRWYIEEMTKQIDKHINQKIINHVEHSLNVEFVNIEAIISRDMFN